MTYVKNGPISHSTMEVREGHPQVTDSLGASWAEI